MSYSTRVGPLRTISFRGRYYLLKGRVRRGDMVRVAPSDGDVPDVVTVYGETLSTLDAGPVQGGARA